MEYSNEKIPKYWINTFKILPHDREELILFLKRKNLDLSKSHYIMGRWENIYISLPYVPQVKKILQNAGKLANQILNKKVVIPHRGLGYHSDEFWFNIAKPGQSTAWHDHKKGAVLSGVYYIDIPPLGGNIKFRSKKKKHEKEWTVKSITGQMILFPSELNHAVEENKGTRERISMSFNFFSLPLSLTTNRDDYSAKKYYG